MYGFYRWFQIVNLDLFSELDLPDGVDKNRLIKTMLLRGGEFETIYSDADFVKEQIGVISKNWYDTIKRWKEALDVEYAPLENYDRIEDWSDITHGTSDSSVSGSSGHNGTTSKSAFNSSSLVTDTGDGSTDSSESHAEGSADNTAVHSGRVHGNIGVTTSSKMLEEFMVTRKAWGNFYDHVADLFLRELVIPIY